MYSSGPTGAFQSAAADTLNIRSRVDMDTFVIGDVLPRPRSSYEGWKRDNVFMGVNDKPRPRSSYEGWKPFYFSYEPRYATKPAIFL